MTKTLNACFGNIDYISRTDGHSGGTRAVESRRIDCDGTFPAVGRYSVLAT